MDQLLPEEPFTDKKSGPEPNLPLGNGVVLLARDILLDPNFMATVVLICIYSKDGGAYGLVLNRISHMPLSEIFDGYNQKHREVYIGGPVQQDEIQIVQLTSTPVKDSHRVADGVYLGGKWEDIDALLSLDPRTTRLFLGYSGWGPGQIEAELEKGAWDVFNVDLKKLLSDTDWSAFFDLKNIADYLETLKIEKIE
jgi:putative transcriptional regulator